MQSETGVERHRDLNILRSLMVNLVTIGGKLYMVDLGFGSNGPTQPLPLEDGYVMASIEPSSMRLIRDFIPDQTDRGEDQKLWIYQYRTSHSTGWRATYAFTDTEFLPQDYEIANLFTSTSRKTFFTYRIVVVKYILDDRN